VYDDEAPDTATSPTVVVTGAASGIGAATILELGRRAVNVLAVDRDEDRLLSAVSIAGVTVVPHVADVTDDDAFAAAVGAAVERFGGIDGMMNNSGILGPMSRFSDYPTDEFDRVIATNVRAVFVGMKITIPLLRDRGGGAIVNIASTGGMIGAPELAGYIAAKHAVVGLTRSAALDVARDNISVNAVCPGATDTPMIAQWAEGKAQSDVDRQHAVELVTPVGRLGRPEEIADTAVWLLLDCPSFLTGAVVPVDGAQTAQ